MNHAWWDEPEFWRVMAAVSRRGEFTFRQLPEHDAARLKTVLADLFREQKDPQDFTAFEWKVILGDMDASEGEVWDVQREMGRVWR